tara:strand:- start:1130 stop:1741 length:612 start_codon:yes stop_codon:yes gene_type:complete
VLFQADYFLKKFSFGDAPVPGVKMPSLFDTDKSNEAARQWFVIKKSNIHVSKDNVVYAKVVMGVDARRLTMGKDGYEDAVLQDPNDPAQQHAANFTKNFDKIAEGVPVVHELRECAKAMVMATWLVDRNNLNQNEGSTNKITNKFIQKMVNRFRTNDKLLKGFEPKSIVKVSKIFLEVFFWPHVSGNRPYFITESCGKCHFFI